MIIFSQLWDTLLYVPILNLLVGFYHVLFQNLGLSIIAMTVAIKAVTFPLTKPSIEVAKKQKGLQPEIAKLKKKFKNKQVFAQKQMELFKKNGINPMSGCLPQIIQFLIIIALYRVFTNLLSGNGVMISSVNDKLYNWDYLKFAQDAVLNTKFLYLNLSKPDQFYILPVLSAAAQFFLSKYMMKSTVGMKTAVKDTPDKKDDIMYNMQGQMAYMMPIMTLVIGVSLPSGLILYWFISTVLMILQYVLIFRKSKKVEN